MNGTPTGLLLAITSTNLPPYGRPVGLLLAITSGAPGQAALTLAARSPRLAVEPRSTRLTLEERR